MKATLIELDHHKAVLDKDDLALSKLYDLYGDKIIRTLKRWYRTVAKRDEALIFEAVNEAFYGYFNNPSTFNPQQNTLQRFLEIAADRDLKNLLSKEKKHLLRKDLPEDVELEEKFWNSIAKSDNSADATIITDEMMQAVQQLLAIYFLTDTDILLAKMVLSKDRETELYIKVLQIEQLTIGEQRKEVKKTKDRIKKVLERNDIESRIKNLLR